MGTFTAEIIIGQAHPNHGGIDPTHLMFLSENSRSAWILYNQTEDLLNQEKVIWIPTVENMLEDALLMVAIYVVNNLEIKSVPEVKKILNKEHVTLYDEIQKEVRNKLYLVCRSIEYKCKIITVVFEHSSIRHQLKILENYNIDMEVCLPVYSRHFSQWTQKTMINGSL